MRILAVLAAGMMGCGAAVLDVRQAPYSAAGDGKADDRPALSKALGAAKPGDTVFMPPGDYRMVLGKGARLPLPQGVTLLGRRGASRILLVSDGGEKDHREFLQPASGAVVQGLTVVREGAFPIVVFPLFGEREDVAFRDFAMEGNVERLPGYCHAFQVGNGSMKKLRMERISISGCSFGLFQANNATGSLEDVIVEDSTFMRNKASDLEFNSPNGTMEDLIIRNCQFRNNLSPGSSAGFAVGFANVKRGTVENCRIEGYGSEALHVEDRSEDIRLVGNTIVGGSKVQTNGVILVVNDSRGVAIERNYVDARPNENKTSLILVTAGGPKFKNPSNVSVKGNILINGPLTRRWYLQPGSGPEPEGNIVHPEPKP